jgi:hypothetical protein
VVSKGQYTNVLIHSLFAGESEQYQAFLGSVPVGVSPDVDLGGMKGMKMHTEGVKKKITNMLKARKNGVMVAEDMHAELGLHNIDRKQRKWFNKMIDTLSKSGHVEKAEIVPEDGPKQKCVRWLADFVPELEMEAAKTAKKPEGDDKTVGEGGLLADLPLDYQVYRSAGIGGEEGVTAKVGFTLLAFLSFYA